MLLRFSLCSVFLVPRASALTVFHGSDRSHWRDTAAENTSGFAGKEKTKLLFFFLS